MIGDRLKLISVGVVFFIALIASAPASLLTPIFARVDVPIEVASVEGTIWRGRLKTARVRDLELGDVNFRVKALSLIVGRAVIDFDTNGRDLFGQGRLFAGVGGGIGAQNLRMRINVTRATRRILVLGARLDGEALVSIERALLRRSGCMHAAGEVRTDAMNEVFALAGAEPMELSGTLACVDKALALNLMGESGDGRLLMNVAYDANHQYRVDASVSNPSPAISGVLSQVGFVEDEGGLALNVGGQLKGL